MAMAEKSSNQMRQAFKRFNRFMLLLWRLGLGRWGNGTRLGGSVMVLLHTGRKTGLTRYTPVNYAWHQGDVYCTVGFGASADWYRNLLVNPEVELWTLEGRFAGIAEDASDSEDAPERLKQVLIASGFAAPLFGVHPTRMTEAELEQLLGAYRLIRIRPTQARTGPGGPGDLAWIWPLTTMLLLICCLRRRR